MNIEKPISNNSIKNIIGVLANAILMDIHPLKYEAKGICGLGSNGCVFLVKSKVDNQLYVMKCVNLLYYLTKRFELNPEQAHFEIYKLFDQLTEQLMHSSYQITDCSRKMVDNFGSVAEKNSFYREFEALKCLPHTGKTVCLLDYGYFNIESNGEKNFNYNVPYIVMSLMPGRPLTYYIEMDVSPLKRLKNILNWTGEMIELVSLIHDNGVIHRDLYPNNLLFDSDTGTLSLIDFGAALTLKNKELDTPGERRGARRFMSPEQFRDPNQVNFCSDYFFIGAFMFYSLTRQTPFERYRDTLTLPACFDDIYKNELLLSKDAMKSISTFINTLLQYIPEKRFQTIEELRMAFNDMKLILEKELLKYE